MFKERKDLRKRFEEKIKVESNGCHEWQSTMSQTGYGKFWYQGKQIFAHRMAYIFEHGQIPGKLYVLHKCDNRKCANPAHLYLGTQKQNVADKIDRCKWYGQMKFKNDFILQCQKLYEQGCSQQVIANQLGCSQHTVSRFVRNLFKQRI